MSSPLQPVHDYFTQNNLWHKSLDLKRGDHLHYAGDTDTNVYYVESGTLRSYVFVNDEEEQVIRFGYQGDFIVAMDSFFTGQPTILYAEALRKTTVRVIKRTKYEAAIMNDPVLNKTWQQILSWMVIGQLEREIDLLTNDPAERYRRVLERSPRLFQEVPAKYIANYLRMTPETLSRLKGR